MSKLRAKVFVGVSGGVDSSASLALLKDAGYDVIGVFIKVWQPDWIECTWKEDRLDAMRVCAVLGVPFLTLDLEKEYKKEVVDYMIAEYGAGRTPNPDVMCNKYVKFGAFYSWARAQGAEFVATGHYATTTHHKDGNVTLSISKDHNKDQTYFLWTLPQDVLQHTLFPIGHLEKSDVRKLAEKYKLPTAAKKDSQGLCFIGKIDMKDFLKEFIKMTPGNVLNEKGEIIGKHEGALLYTLGERHGFLITHKTPNDPPYYVISKDVEKNTVTVSHRTETGSLSGAKTSVTIIHTNWIRSIPALHVPLMSRARYRQELAKCHIEEIDGSRVTVRFTESQNSLSPGQSLVFYSGSECVGGGIIE